MNPSPVAALHLDGGHLNSVKFSILGNTNVSSPAVKAKTQTTLNFCSQLLFWFSTWLGVFSFSFAWTRSCWTPKMMIPLAGQPWKSSQLFSSPNGICDHLKP